jgi:hypothetical protein
MAIKKAEIPFLGTRGGLNGYLRHGVNIVRKSTPLTPARIRKEPAFEGFRKSSTRLKNGAAIAATLYNQIPKELKRFNLYRLLTGESIKMIKQGMEKAEICEKLFLLYVDPILQKPA